MGLLTRLEELAQRAETWPDRVGEWSPGRAGRPRLSRMKAPPRHLTEDDVGEFMIASGEAAERDRKKREAAVGPPLITPRESKDFIKWVKTRHPHRLARLGRDLDWLRREARRFGISPEEIRWLL